MALKIQKKSIAQILIDNVDIFITIEKTKISLSLVQNECPYVTVNTNTYLILIFL